MAEIMEMGKKLFFPRGKSKFGNIAEFKFTMRDFTEDLLDASTTLGDQYEVRRVKILRLYLTIDKISTCTPEDVDNSFQSDDDFQIHEVNFSFPPQLTVEESGLNAEDLPMIRDVMAHTPAQMAHKTPEYKVQILEISKK